MKLPELTARQRLVDSACIVFSEYGFEAATTRQISELANIQHSNLYYYFKSKKILYSEVFRIVYDVDNAITYHSILHKEPHLFTTLEGKSEAVERIVWNYFQRHVHISGWKQKFIVSAIKDKSLLFIQLIDEVLNIELEALEELFYFLRPKGTSVEARYWTYFLDSQGLYYFMTPEKNRRCLQKKKNRTEVIQQIVRIMLSLVGLPIPEKYLG